jgi:putative nucleotidyltransferase with HDIG domain
MTARLDLLARRPLRLPFITLAMAALDIAVLATALRDWAPSDLLATLVTAATVSLLGFFPMYIDPAGELLLTTVIAIPALVLFGWPPTFIGSVLGTAVGFLHRPSRDTVIQTTERLASLTVAGAVVAAFSSRRPDEAITAVVAASLAYMLCRTLIASARMHADEGFGLTRAFRHLAASTFFHYGVFTVVAGVAVWAVSNDLSMTSRLLVPVLAATVTLQLYLWRILRGREQRRVLAAVSVLAAAVDAKDPYTADHSAEVAELSRRIARIMGLDEPEVHRVYLAGLLHDVGKMVVPQSILLKPGKLTDEEWKIMESHVEAGVRIVESIGGLAQIAPLVAASHERIDGRGYPRGLRGDEIPIGARINLVVDAYNALTTDRPYRAAKSPDDALRELEAHSGTQFDPAIVLALRKALERPSQPPEPAPAPPVWAALLGRPAFALLWTGELVSFLGDEILFIALSLWVYELTHSITILAVTLVAATLGQGLLGLLAGAIADRRDRRAMIIATDVGRAAIVAAIPFVLPASIPLGLALVLLLNIGAVFFRAAVYALIPSVVTQDELPTANALFQTTERIAEVLGGVLGGATVLLVGYHAVFFIDAGSFFVSAVCVGLMPVAWGAGLGLHPRGRVMADIGDGLRYMWRVPLQRVLALLIGPGYLTLAFTALQTPMIRTTAGLSVMAYGMINSVLGAGKLMSAVIMSGTRGQWARLSFVVSMFLTTAFATAAFGLTTAYPVLMAAAFLFGVGNVATNIANATLAMANTPTGLLGRVVANRQAFSAIVKVVGMLVFGRLADLYGPPTALVSLGLVSGIGVALLWLLAGRPVAEERRAAAPESVG